MAALAASFWRDDPDQDAADLAAAERDLDQLRYAEPKNAGHREKIRFQIGALERGIARMKARA